MSSPEHPDDLSTADPLDTEPSADYVNTAVEEAQASLTEAPNYDRLAAFLTTLREGYLFVDVSGTPGSASKQGPRIRTIRSMKGQLVLPVFTSMESLRAAVGSAGRKGPSPKGVLTPSLDALRMIFSDRFVAIQLNPGPNELVVLRKYIERVIDGEELTPALLESLK